MIRGRLGGRDIVCGGAGGGGTLSQWISGCRTARITTAWHQARAPCCGECCLGCTCGYIACQAVWHCRCADGCTTGPRGGVVVVVVVYIEATDVRLQDSEDYHGLAPGKSAMLWDSCCCCCCCTRTWHVSLPACINWTSWARACPEREGSCFARCC